MTLGELISFLKKQDQDKIIKIGFYNPHSYRGYYEELAFEPCENIPCNEMLKEAEFALNNTFKGWKGGDFKMGENTDVYLAYVGSTGEMISKLLMQFMFDCLDINDLGL